MCIIKKNPRECLLKTRYFCFHSCLYVLYAGCLAVKLRSQYPHVPRSLPASISLLTKLRCWWLRCFVWNCAPHWQGFHFRYTYLGSNFCFSINKLEEERKVFTPFDEKSMNRVKHKVHGRPLIHAHVRKIQSALASLVGSQSRQLSYIVRLWITKMTQKSLNPLIHKSLNQYILKSLNP